MNLTMLQFWLNILNSILFAAILSSIYYYVRKKFIMASMYTTEKLNVPFQAVPALLGKDGERMKEIVLQTDTQIYTNRMTNARVTCIIRGHRRGVRVAKFLIENFVENFENFVTQKIWIPSPAIGYLIGANGDRIEYLRQSSSTRIRIVDKQNDGPNTLVQLTGLPENIHKAKNAINCLIEQYEKRQTTTKNSVSNTIAEIVWDD